MLQVCWNFLPSSLRKLYHEGSDLSLQQKSIIWLPGKQVKCYCNFHQKKSLRPAIRLPNKNGTECPMELPKMGVFKPGAFWPRPARYFRNHLGAGRMSSSTFRWHSLTREASMDQKEEGCWSSSCVGGRKSGALEAQKWVGTWPLIEKPNQMDALGTSWITDFWRKDRQKDRRYCCGSSKPTSMTMYTIVHHILSSCLPG